MEEVAGSRSVQRTGLAQWRDDPGQAEAWAMREAQIEAEIEALERAGAAQELSDSNPHFAFLRAMRAKRAQRDEGPAADLP